MEAGRGKRHNQAGKWIPYLRRSRHGKPSSITAAKNEDKAEGHALPQNDKKETNKDSIRTIKRQTKHG